jgi:hypothetical protein
MGGVLHTPPIFSASFHQFGKSKLTLLAGLFVQFLQQWT